MMSKCTKTRMKSFINLRYYIYTRRYIEILYYRVTYCDVILLLIVSLIRTHMAHTHVHIDAHIWHTHAHMWYTHAHVLHTRT